MRLRWFYGWTVVVAAAFMMFGASGSRFSFGIFMRPLQEEFGWDRALLSGAASVTLLLSGLLRPLAGYLADRLGPRLICLSGVVLAGLALAGMGAVRDAWQMYALYTVFGIALAATSPATMAGLATRWFRRRRGMALSVISTGSAAGELLIIPMTMAILVLTNWRMTYLALAALLLLVLLPTGLLLIRNEPEPMGLHPDGEDAATAARAAAVQSGRQSATVNDAMRTLPFWQLGFGFFACGFTMSFANTHMAAWAMDMGFSEVVAAGAVGLIGGFSIAGALLLGWLSDRLSRRYLLSFVYLMRGVAYLFLLRVGMDNEALLLVGAAILGFSWTATVPLTTAIVADQYGPRYVASIAGTMFTIMPIGTALGAWLGGFIYDHQHSYMLSMVLAAVTGLLASAVVFMTSEVPWRAPATAEVAQVAGGSD